MASRGINKVILVGNLGGDPEVRYTANGSAIANITMATSESWRDKNTGEQREKTEWHRVVLFGRVAEVAGEFLKKGSQVYIEGQLQTRKWQDQGGQDRYTTEVVVQGFNGVMQMLGGKTQQSWGEPNQPTTQPTQATAQNQTRAGSMAHMYDHHQPAQPNYNEPPPQFDDDIPF